MDPPPPPPARPSPHRFVLAGKGGGKKPVASSSNLRHEVPRPPQPSPRTPVHRPQFSTAPRFSAASSSTPLPGNDALSTPRPRFSLTGSTQRDDVQDTDSQDAYDDEDEMLLQYEPREAIPTTEHEDVQTVSRDDWDHAVQATKRQKLQSTGDNVSPMTSERAADSHSTSTRFVVPQTTSNGNVEAHPPNKPSFLRSSISAQEPSEPLPEAFSPHKRGQRFVPGGMAAEVQSWIFEAGNAAVQSRRGQGYLYGQDYAVIITVDVLEGHNPTLLLGTTDEGVEERVMLAEEGSRPTLKKTAVVSGCRIGIRAPVWRTQIEGQQWINGVDWRVIE